MSSVKFFRGELKILLNILNYQKFNTLASQVRIFEFFLFSRSFFSIEKISNINDFEYKLKTNSLTGLHR